MIDQAPISIASAWRVGSDLYCSLNQPRLMGVLNVTPDSFSDGGQHLNPARAVGRALRLINEGASIIDIGGESTRPGAERVPDEVQIDRTVPVIEELRRHADVLISVDTTRASVAEAAIRAGARIINDVAAGGEDNRLFNVAAEHQCGLIIMHRRVPPGEDTYSDEYRDAPEYHDVVDDVRQFLAARARAAIEAGIDPAAIVIDPGLGFGKSVEQNFELIARSQELLELGYPILSAASRKSFVGAVSETEKPTERVYGSVAVSVAQWMAGIRLFRVHDVAAHAQALAVARAIKPGPDGAAHHG